MEAHGGQVVELSAWRRRSVRKLGPVLGPISGAQVASADAGKLLNRDGSIRWHAARAPVRDGLDRLAQGVGQAFQAELPDCGLKGGNGCHACSLHDTCSLSTRIVFTNGDTRGMPDTVWNRIDSELQRRKDAREELSSWAALGDKIGVTNQVTTNWKSRGVPPKRFQEIAEALGWSLEQLVGKEDKPAPPKSADQGDFLQAFRALIETLSEEDRQEAYAFALGRALKNNPAIAKRAAQYAADLAGNTTPAGRGQHHGGLNTNFGGMDELPEPDQKKASGGRR